MLLWGLFREKMLWMALGFGFVLGAGFVLIGRAEVGPDVPLAQKRIVLIESGAEMPLFSAAPTIEALLAETHHELEEGDTVFPGGKAPLLPGSRVTIVRARSVAAKVDGVTRTFRTQAETVEGALMDAAVPLDEDDLVTPLRETPLTEGMSIAITRVEIREETAEKNIAFTEQTHEDPELSWRKKIITQKGEAGTDRLTYRVSYHDGKEVNRRLMQAMRVKDPIPQIVTQGTYVKVGKSHTGAASWYAFTGTLSAANPWLPIGSYVRVTNTDNGKNVIVRINDRGPFAPGRIIDLDKVAFQKIASLGAGVVNVTMEEIVN